MSDESTPAAPRPRPEPLGRFVLARAGRLARAGGRPLARGVTTRHEPQRLAAAPRLAPAAEPVLARSAAASPPPPAEVAREDALHSEAERLSEVSGYSPWAMEYLLGNDSPPGTTAFSPKAAETAVARMKQQRANAPPRRRAAIEEGPGRIRARSPPPRQVHRRRPSRCRPPRVMPRRRRRPAVKRPARATTRRRRRRPPIRCVSRWRMRPRSPRSGTRPRRRRSPPRAYPGVCPERPRGLHRRRHP
jgi:hypothetical protein